MSRSAKIIELSKLPVRQQFARCPDVRNCGMLNVVLYKGRVKRGLLKDPCWRCGKPLEA